MTKRQYRLHLMLKIQSLERLGFHELAKAVAAQLRGLTFCSTLISDADRQAFANVEKPQAR